MVELLSIMLTVIAPIMAIMGFAFIIGRRFNPDPRSLSVYLIYLFTPALVFSGIYTTDLSGGEISGIAMVVVGVALVQMVFGTVIARTLKYSDRQEASLVLTIILVNAANYGIPLNTFAFGAEGESAAIVYYVISALVGNTLGVYFASRGSVSAREAVANVFKVPIAYAAVIALILNVMNIELPLIIERSVIDIAAPASIPVMLALLGLQLSRLRFGKRKKASDDMPSLADSWQPILLASGLRLLVAPFIALALVTVVGLSGVSYKVAIIESSMPTAVLASALATQFGADAKYVSAVTLVTTLASIGTLSILLLLLGGVA